MVLTFLIRLYIIVIVPEPNEVSYHGQTGAPPPKDIRDGGGGREGSRAEGVRSKMGAGGGAGNLRPPH